MKAVNLENQVLLERLLTLQCFLEITSTKNRKEMLSNELNGSHTEVVVPKPVLQVIGFLIRKLKRWLNKEE